MLELSGSKLKNTSAWGGICRYSEYGEEASVTLAFAPSGCLGSGGCHSPTGVSVLGNLSEPLATESRKHDDRIGSDSAGRHIRLAV